MSSNQSQPINISQALPGRQSAIPHSPYHAVNHHSIDNIPKNAEIAYFAMGCFGELSVYFGSNRAFTQHPLAIVADYAKSNLRRSVYGSHRAY